MKPYVMPTDSSRYMDDVLGQRIKQIDGQWYWTEWHVAYAQHPMDTSENFVTREQADAEFNRRLADLREGWSFGGRGKPAARFSETVESDGPDSKRIRFRSIRKNGKPGTLTGLLYMHRINRPLQGE